MAKKIGFGLLGLLFVVLGVGLYIGMPYLNIVSSYAAKNLCSGVFVSGRSPESLRAQDLHAVSFSSQTVDTANQRVTANVFGLVPATAIYRSGLGCTLVNELTESQMGVAAEWATTLLAEKNSNESNQSQ